MPPSDSPPIVSSVLAVWSRGNVSTGSTYSRPLPAPPPLLGSNDHPERSEPALLAIFSDTVTRWILDYGYLAIFLLMLLESACIPIPSEVTMLFGGALASAGFAGPGQELDLVLVILAGVAGNLAGSWLAYAGGAVGGRPLLDRFGRSLLVRPHEVDRAHDWFERHGEAAVFFGRLLPVIRTFISLPAGIARMNPVRFTVYTVLGCLPFVSVIAWLGYRAGDNWVKVEAGPPTLLLADRGGDPGAGRHLRRRDAGARCGPSTPRSTRSGRSRQQDGPGREPEPGDDS